MQELPRSSKHRSQKSADGSTRSTIGSDSEEMIFEPLPQNETPKPGEDISMKRAAAPSAFKRVSRRGGGARRRADARGPRREIPRCARPAADPPRTY